jgi:hypothetical protein
VRAFANGEGTVILIASHGRVAHALSAMFNGQLAQEAAGPCLQIAAIFNSGTTPAAAGAKDQTNSAIIRARPTACAGSNFDPHERRHANQRRSKVTPSYARPVESMHSSARAISKA